MLYTKYFVLTVCISREKLPGTLMYTYMGKDLTVSRHSSHLDHPLQDSTKVTIYSDNAIALSFRSAHVLSRGVRSSTHRPESHK